MTLTETILIYVLTLLTCACCVMFWISIIKPVRQHFQFEHVIAEFRREVAQWDHDQQCH